MPKLIFISKWCTSKGLLCGIVDNLEETLYRFRVKAVNKFGESAPSEYVDLIEEPHYAEVYLRCKDGHTGRAVNSDISLFELTIFPEQPIKQDIIIPFKSRRINKAI